MEQFRAFLQQEFVRRTTKNPAYSLRSFAQQLGVNHATLSTLISGKRKITAATVQRMAQSLHLSPAELTRFTATASNSADTPTNYFVIQQDTFSFMSEWYFDAILELALIPSFKLEPEVIANSIGITTLQAKIALETLVRLELLSENKSGGFKVKHQNSTNILDPDFTSAAHKKHQKSVLEKSLAAIDTVDRTERDHTSTTMAILKKDLPKAKALIKKFRIELNEFLQRKDVTPDEVYQLQVSFFPLSQNTKNKNKQENL